MWELGTSQFNTYRRKNLKSLYPFHNVKLSLVRLETPAVYWLRTSRWLTRQLWKWRQYISAKRRWIYTGLRGVTPQKVTLPVQKKSSLVRIPRHINPLHTVAQRLLRLMLILSHCLGLPGGVFVFSNQFFVWMSYLSHVCYMTIVFGFWLDLLTAYRS